MTGVDEFIVMVSRTAPPRAGFALMVARRSRVG
jgi:hypothetical protein